MLVDLMQIVTIITNIYISFTEKKKRIYVATFLLNFAQLLMYLFNSDLTTALIYVIIVIRSYVYIYKDVFDTDLIPYSLILAQLIVGFTTIESPLQIMSILLPCYSCWYLWFYNDTQKLRIGNIISNAIWAVYNICTGLYIILIMRAITVISNLIAYIRRKKELENIECESRA